MTTQQVGGAVGLSVLVSLSALQTNGLPAASVAERAALTTGYQVAFGIAAGLVLLALVFAGAVLRPAEAVNEASVPKRETPLGDVALPGSRVP